MTERGMMRLSKNPLQVAAKSLYVQDVQDYRHEVNLHIFRKNLVKYFLLLFSLFLLFYAE